MSIQLVNVTKHYRSLHGLHTVYSNLNLTLPRHKNVGIIGHNGAGKSTLLKLIAGVEKPDKGRVIRNMSVSWPLGFTGFFQPDVTGAANINFCARLYNRDPKQLIEFVREWSGLGKFLDWPVRGYSTGMRGRLGFALSLAIKFDCLLVDEVFSAGDASFRQKAAAAIEEMRSRSSLIMVSHDYRLIESLCDYVVVIGMGPPTLSSDVRGEIKRCLRDLQKRAEPTNQNGLPL